MKPNQPSFLFITSVLVAVVSLFFTTLSPLVLALVPLVVLPLVFKGRVPRDSAGIWGGRLALYAICAVVGRAPLHSYFFFASQAFVTLGLILGGELVLQSFREPPRGFKFDPLMFLVSGLLFAIGFSSFSYAPHLWITGPLWMFLTLFALNDVREDAPRVGFLTRVRQFGLIAIAVCGGFLGHSALTANRGALTALSARLLQNSSVSVSEAGVADAPQMSSGFNNNANTSRLLRITGNLTDSHLRAAAFDQYARGTWGPAISRRTIEPALPKETKEQKSAITGNVADNGFRTDWKAKITVLRDSNKVAFAPLNVAALVPLEGTNSFDWSRFAGPIQVSDSPPFSFGIVESQTAFAGMLTAQGPLCVAPDAQQRESLLTVPDEIDPRVKTLAQTITKSARTPEDKVVAVREYLLKHYKYSMDFQKGSQDPISDFLLNKKSAHCQYFAASAVMLLRSVGVPARYATGFWAHEQGDDGSLIVRGRDAHAWCEAYIDKVGWLNVEATPPDGRADPRANPISAWQKFQEKIEDTWARVRNWFGNLSALQILGLMSVMLAVWVLERWRQARKKARALPTKPLPPLELQPLARGFERALQKRGITLADGKTWSETLPNEWQTEREWVELYNRARFDQRDETRLQVLTDKLRELERVRRN